MAEEKNECCQDKKWHHRGSSSGGALGGGFYFLAFIGIAIYNVQQVTGFGPALVGILKAIVWPAFLMFKVYTMLHM